MRALDLLRRELRAISADLAIVRLPDRPEDQKRVTDAYERSRRLLEQLDPEERAAA